MERMEIDKSGTVSIIIPVYHLEKYIEQTMQCVLDQTYTDWELLMVEDNSDDRSGEIIEEFIRAHDLSGKARLIHLTDDFGAAAARNRGVRESKGRYIAYLDGDDVWRKDKLEKQLAFMHENDAAFTFSGYEFANADAVGTGKVVRVKKEFTYKQALKNTTIFTSTVMFDTEKIPREKLMMPKVKSEDTALWWNILREGVTAYGLDENLVLYRRPGKSLSSNKLEAIRRIWMLYRRNEHFNIFKSAYYFVFWAFTAVWRRI